MLQKLWKQNRHWRQQKWIKTCDLVLAGSIAYYIQTNEQMDEWVKIFFIGFKQDWESLNMIFKMSSIQHKIIPHIKNYHKNAKICKGKDNQHVPSPRWSKCWKYYTVFSVPIITILQEVRIDAPWSTWKVSSRK